MSTNEEIIGVLLDNMDTLYIRNKTRATEKKVIGNLFNDLYKSYRKVKTLIRKNKVRIKTIVPNTPSDIPNTDLLDSHYSCKDLRKIVYSKTEKVVVYTCVLRNIKITINVNDLTMKQDIHKYTIHHVLSMIDMLLGYANKKDQKSLNIFLYLTNKMKWNKIHNNPVIT